jgi:holo-[acyl-carrier protein] synthase
MNSPVLKHGIDLIEIDRVKKAISRHGPRFLARIYTPAELDECGELVSSLAVRFAAKEAVAKALGTGIGDINWCEIEICRAESGAPVLNLYGSAANIAKIQGLKAWSISLSHTRTLAMASVVAVG